VTKTADQLALLYKARYPLIYLLTYEELRAERMCREVAEQLKVAEVHWSPVSGAPGLEDGLEEPQRFLSRLIEDSTLPGLYLAKDFHLALDDPMVGRRLRELLPYLATGKKTLVVISPVLVIPRELEKDCVVLDLELPEIEELGKILDTLHRQTGRTLVPKKREAALRAARGLTEQEAIRVFSKVLAAGDLDFDDVGRIVEEKRQILRQHDVLEYFEPNETLASVGGLSELKRWLSERASAFEDKARKFGLPQPKGMLLLGVQGCGKSLVSKAVASLWKLPLIRLDLAAIFSSRHTAEENMRNAIRIAESLAPMVLWVDEIEKGFAGTGAEDQAAVSRVFGTFITWLQEKTKPVFVIATANEVQNLPPELLRKGRFDEIFFVDLPDHHEREQILSVHLKKRGRDPGDFDLDALAKKAEHLNGAELEQAVISALYAAFHDSREVEQQDLSKAIEDTVPLYVTYEEKIKELRDWARNRARWASLDVSLVDLFKEE